MPQSAAQLVQCELQEVEHRLLQLCGDEQDPLSAAAREAVQAGGKRLRPTLVLLSAKAAGRISDDSLLLSVAVETMHLASLMHDDVVDHAVLRRGQPTVRQSWGDRMAVLVGDYLASRAYYELAPLRDSEYVGIFAAVGIEMCRAEARSSQIEAQDLTEADCLEIARGKTAGLFAASCQAGALSGGAGAEASLHYRAYGEHLGLAFQLADDLLDIYGSEDALGKAPGRDVLTDQFTFPIVHALGGEGGEAVREAIAAFNASASDDDLRRLGEVVEVAGGRTAAEALAREETARARTALQLVASAEPEASAALEALLEQVVVRTS